MNYTIQLNEQQMQIMRDALDFYERVLGLGQLEEIESHWRWDADVRGKDFQEKSEAIRYSLYSAKLIGWGCGPGASRGIRSENVPARFQIAYDMTQAIRKSMSDVRIFKANIEKDMETVTRLMNTVDQNEYWPTQPKVPKIQISWTEKN